MLALIQEDNTLHETNFKDHKFEFNLHQINEANRLIQQEANDNPVQSFEDFYLEFKLVWDELDRE